MLHYGGKKPLKVEVSYRSKSVSPTSVTRILGYLVYTVTAILRMKLQEYINRDKIRDLYDVVFIGTRYWGALSEESILNLREALGYKGLEQFDFVVKDQHDDLIDNGELAVAFLALWEKLDLR